jgi:branched-chain amino acid transport system substrate-binding protein
VSLTSRRSRLPGLRHVSRGTAVAAASVLLMLTGCGTRLSTNQATDQLRTVYGNGTSSLGTAGNAANGGAQGPSGAVVGGSATPGAVVGGGSGASGSGASGQTGATTGQANGGGTTSGTTGGTSGSSAKAPILVGMSCDCTGVVGGAHAAGRDMWIAWKNWVNAHGGIDGHPIKLFYADDNNSATQAIQNVKTFVEQNHVVALVHLVTAAGALAPIAEYAQKHGIAVVGGSGYEAEWTKYPSMFSTATADPAQDYAWAAEMKNAGKKIVASTYCSDAPVCKDKETLWKQSAEKLGLTVRGEYAESLTNPDYSADCAQAQANGVESIVVIQDGASATRVARDCAQQGYHPLLVVPNPFDGPPANMNGDVGAVGSFPWFITSGSPALDEYGAARKQYFHGTCTTFCSLGWADAKLLQKALTGRVSATPSSQDVLNGLWALHNETLGGLTPPMTFHKNQPASPVNCSYRVVVKDGDWVSPTGMTPVDCKS